MKTLNLIQGSREWCAARLNYFTASEAPAMMAASKNVSRNDLLHMKATGTEQEFSDWFQENVLDRGHEVEAKARAIAEAIIGEELYPVTGIADDGKLSASFDGLTMMEDVGWECKQWNESKAARVNYGSIPEEDYWQLVQQLVVSGADRILYMVTDGTEERCAHIWVHPNEDHIGKLLAGWKQFEQDLAAYQPQPYEPEPEGATPEQFPALFIDIAGKVEGTNLATFEQAVTARIQAINTDLQTDQDFADAEKMVKFLGEKEKEVEKVKELALAKTADIDALFKTVDHLREEMRQKRLELDKLVKERKKEKKTEIAMAGRKAVDEHIAILTEGLGGSFMPNIITDFNGAMKGKRTVATLQSAADDEVARAKIEASEIAETIRANIQQLDDAGNYFLFSDRHELILKDPDHLKAIIENRISAHEKAEEARLAAEREQIRKEEQEKLEREAAEQAVQSAEQQNQQPKPAETAPINSTIAAHKPASGSSVPGYEEHRFEVVCKIIVTAPKGTTREEVSLYVGEQLEKTSLDHVSEIYITNEEKAA